MAESTTTLGKLLVRLMMDASQFEAANKKAQSDITSLTGFFDRLGTQLNTVVVGGLAAASAALAGFATATTVMGASFENAVAKVGAIAGATGDELGVLEKAARDIGKATAFTATEAAIAMNDLAQAGLKVGDIVNASKAAVLLAGATGSTLSQSTGLLASSLSQFQLASTDTARVADVFSQAMNTTLFDMSSLTEAMKYAGVTGAGLGYTIEETTAAVAEFRNLGLEGSLAGTAFKMMMAQAAHETDRGAAILKKYNLEYKDINPEIKSFSEIMETVGKAAMTTTDSMVIFGSRSGAAVAQIASTFGSGTTKFYETLGALEDSAGSTQETYDKMMDTVAGQFQIAASAIEELMLTVFDQYREPLTTLLQTLGEVISYVAATFGKHTGQMRSGLKGVLDGMNEWLQENKQQMVVWLTSIANIATKAIQFFADILPFLDDIAIVMASIFIAQKIYAFATAIKVAIGVLQALVVVEGEAAAAATAATGGLNLAIAAVVAGTVALATFTAGMISASNAAEQLAAAEKEVEDAARGMTKAYEDHYASVLPAQQARIRAIMAEKAASGELTEEERRHFDQILNLNAASAASAVLSGELVDIQGELLDVETLVNERGNEGLEIIDRKAAHFAELAAAEKANAAALAKAQKEMSYATEINYRGEIARLEEKHGNIDQINAQLGESQRKEEEYALASKRLLDAKTNAIDKAQKEGLAAAKKVRAEDLQDQGAANNKAVDAFATASQKRLELERQLGEEISAIGRGRLGDIDVEEQKRIASTRKVFEDEREAAIKAGQAVIDTYRNEAEAIAKIQRLAAIERTKFQTEEAKKLAQEQADIAFANLTRVQDIERETKHAADSRIEALEHEHQMVLAEMYAATDAEKARIDAAYQQRMATVYREVEGTAIDFLDKRITEAEKLERGRAAFMQQFAGLSGEQIAAIEQKYDQQIWAAKLDQAKESLAQIVAAGQAAADAFSSAWDKVFGGLKNGFEQVSGLSLNFGTIVSAMTDIAGGVATGEVTDPAAAGSAAGDELAATAMNLIQTFIDAAPAFIESLVSALPGLIDAFIDSIPVILQALTDAIPILVDGVVKLLTDGLQAIIDQLPTILDAILDSIPVIVAAVGDAIVMIVDALPGLVEQIMQALPGIITAIMDAIPEIIVSLMDAIPDIVKAIVAAIPDIIMSFLLGIPDILNAIVRELPTMINELLLALLPLIPSIVIAFVTEFIPMIPMIVMEAISAMFEGIWSMVKDFGEWLLEAFENVIKAIGKAVNPFDKKLSYDTDLFNAVQANAAAAVGMHTGIDYVPAMMRVTLHPGEAVIPAHRNRTNPGAASVPVPPPLPGAGAGAGGGGATTIGVYIGERMVDQVTVSAMDRGHAPQLTSRIQTAAGVVKGYSRGRFQGWSKP